MKSKGVNRADFRDTLLGAVVAIAILGTIGHFSEWLRDRITLQLELSIAFFLGGCLCIALSPRRWWVVIYSLVAIVAWGTLGTIVHASLDGLPLILPAALLLYLVLRWKGKTIAQGG